jgi:hypothetical protein
MNGRPRQNVAADLPWRSTPMIAFFGRKNLPLQFYGTAGFATVKWFTQPPWMDLKLTRVERTD